MRKITTILLLLISIFSFAQTADDFASYRPFNGKFPFGANPGWYGSNWTTQNIISLCAGKPDAGIRGLGTKSFRMKLSDEFLAQWGLKVLIPDYEYIKTVGAGQTVAFIGDPAPENRLDSFFTYYTKQITVSINPDVTRIDTVWEQAKVWKGMFEPIWKDGAANPANTMATYLEATVKTYGIYVDFWEIINEPDFTYGHGGWLADADPKNPNTWFFNDPTPNDMQNIKAPFKYYIRALQIAWEVVKKYDPTAYVCTGGIGNRSFLHALLRNGAGKWFDVLSFHTYPEFSTLIKYWVDKVGNVYERHSDRLVDGHMNIRWWMDSILHVFGYDGSHKPLKQFICTETGISAVPGNDGVSGPLVQLNYCLKANITMMIQGSIKLNYWYQTADASALNNHWDRFGMYEYFGGVKPWTATRTWQGIGQKTASDLLYGRTYDPVKTASLNLPSSVRGGAFKGPDGTYIFALWAKTTKDMVEQASATVTLPACIRKEWDYDQTKTTTTVNGIVTLNSTPSFFEPVTALPLDDKPKPSHPQPAKKYLKVEIYDSNGWMLLSRKNLTEKEAERVVLNSPYAVGMYYIKFADTEAFTKKISKLK